MRQGAQFATLETHVQSMQCSNMLQESKSFVSSVQCKEGGETDDLSVRSAKPIAPPQCSRLMYTLDSPRIQDKLLRSPKPAKIDNLCTLMHDISGKETP